MVSRERALLDAAEEVVTRWAVYRASEGKLGGCGLPEALQALSLAWEAYEPEELASPTIDDSALQTGPH